tara:strand:+ start:1349 stop:1858 length:510 start_codon:yes stop_codon:yes gene_type:complete
MASQADKDTAAAQAKQNNNNQAAKDTAAAQGKTQPRNPNTKLDDSHRDSPNYQGSDAHAREMRGSQASSEGIAGSGSVADDDTTGLSGSSTIGEREEAAGLTNTMSGRIDPFYVFDREIPGEETVDHGVHDNTNDILPSPVSSFSAIIAINGKPFSASIQGIIGNEITE